MIESVNYPGFYLSGRDGRIVLAKPKDKDDLPLMIFIKRKGLAGCDYSSFESSEGKGLFIRVRDGHLFLESGRDKGFKKDATFKISPPR
jgi:hypothetical protein